MEPLADMRRVLAGAESLDVQVFHQAQDPDMAQHCQIGNPHRAFAIMGDWLTAPCPPRSGGPRRA